jgi:hypothetical protein
MKSRKEERKIQDALFRLVARKSSQICAPGYTPKDWWECDLWSVTGSGYSVEYEIKRTREDFLADRKKVKERTLDNWERVQEVKHWMLAARSDRGPSKFNFVTPMGMISLQDVPEWAGLIEFRDYSGKLYFREIKKAPRLHKKRVSEEQIQHCQGVFYWRYWDLRAKVA